MNRYRSLPSRGIYRSNVMELEDGEESPGIPGGAPTLMLLLDRFLRPRQGPVRFGIPSPALLDWTLIFVLALALRLHGLAAKPLWIDEVVTKLRVALPLQKLIADSLGHHHLPTYFLLLSTFSPGANAWMLRLPSAIGGAVAAAIGGAVGRTLGGRTAGLTSGLMLAGAPVMVQFGQDARPYALELAFLMLALWGLVTLVCDAEAASGPWRRGANAWAALLLGTAGALSLIGDAAPFLLSANLSAWLIARCLSNLARRRFLFRWITGQASILLVVGPLYLAMSRAVAGNYMVAFAWVPPLDALRVWRIGADVYLLRSANMVSLHLLPAALPGLMLVLPMLAVAGWIALRHRRAARTSMILTFLSLPMLLFLIHPSHPLWLPRYLLWSGAVFLILTGVGTAWLTERWPLVGLAALVAVLLFNLFPFYRSETVPRWDLAATSLSPALAAGADVLVDDNAASMMLRAYLPGGDTALPKGKLLTKPSEAEARLRAGVPVVAVHGPTGQGVTIPTALFQAKLGPLGFPVREARIGHEIVLVWFNPLPNSTRTPLVSSVRPGP